MSQNLPSSKLFTSPGYHTYPLLEFLYMPASYNQAATKDKLLCRMTSAWRVATIFLWRAGREKSILAS